MNALSERPTEVSHSRLYDLFGVVTVLCLGVLPDAYQAIAVYYWNVPVPEEFHYIGGYLIVRSTQVVVPLLLIVKLSNIEWDAVGLRRIRWGADIVSGVGLWLAGSIGFYAAFYFAYVSLPQSLIAVDELEFQFAGPKTGFDYVLLAVASCANGFAEELVVRGFLLTRIERLLRSTWAALMITAILFGLYHLYQGLGPAIGITGLGFVYGAAFCLWRRLWPLIIAHAIADFAGYSML